MTYHSPSAQLPIESPLLRDLILCADVHAEVRELSSGLSSAVSGEVCHIHDRIERKLICVIGGTPSWVDSPRPLFRPNTTRTGVAVPANRWRCHLVRARNERWCLVKNKNAICLNIKRRSERPGIIRDIINTCMQTTNKKRRSTRIHPNQNHKKHRCHIENMKTQSKTTTDNHGTSRTARRFYSTLYRVRRAVVHVPRRLRLGRRKCLLTCSGLHAPLHMVRHRPRELTHLVLAPRTDSQLGRVHARHHR